MPTHGVFTVGDLLFATFIGLWLGIGLVIGVIHQFFVILGGRNEQQTSGCLISLFCPLFWPVLAGRELLNSWRRRVR